MLEFVDNFLNRITMYRLVHLYLMVLVAIAVFLCFFGVLFFNPWSLLFSAVFLVAVGLVANAIFAKFFRVPANIDSTYISTLILSLVVTPAQRWQDFGFLFVAALLVVVSKFVFVIRKRHIFNPAALAVTLSAIAGLGSASWWVGSLPMVPFVLVGGFLIVRKIQRFDLVASFLTISFLTLAAISFLSGNDVLVVLSRVLFDSPIFFFATVMLTEPLTTPPTRVLRLCYGAIVGFLFASNIRVASFYLTAEMALLLGNLFSYLVSPKFKLFLKLKEKIRMAPGLFEFVFNKDQKFDYLPGQYLEWTLGHTGTDSRGNRRFFTIASSPTESDVRLGVKFYDDSSSFKKKLLSLGPGEQIIASQLAGEFTMSNDPGRKYVFIAGGIGITPFRSMVKFLLDTSQKRDVVLFYSVKDPSEIVYRELFDQAKEVSVRTIYNVGRLEVKTIAKEVLDYKDRYFYLSGPRPMVSAFEKVLSEMEVPRSQVKTDFFPGYV